MKGSSKLALAWTSFCVMFTCVSCEKKSTTQGSTPLPLNEEQGAPVEWSWENYERSNELILGAKSVSIQPQQSLEIQSESAGTLTLLIDRPKVSITKGHLWAQMDKVKLDRKREKLELDEEDKKLTKLKVEKFDRPEKLKKAEAELEESRLKVAKMKKLLGSKVLRKNAAKVFGDIKEVNQQALRKLEDELSMAEQKLTMIQEVDSILDKNKDRAEEMELIEGRESFEEVKSRSNYEAPFSGELRVELEYVKDQKEYTVAAREVIGTLNDYTEMHVLLNVLGESWVSLDSKSLVLRLSDRDKTEVLFKEDKIIKNKRTRREEKHYVFSAISEEKPHLRRLNGTTMQAKLVTKLEKRCWIVPKVDVAMHALGKSRSKVWADIVDNLWPGAEILAEGENALAIDYIPSKVKP